jgi:hypothetical protein
MVVGVLGRLVIVARMGDELMGMVVTTVCISIKNLMILIMKRDLLIMKIPSQMMVLTVINTYHKQSA